ncbi:MAG: pyruvate kinase [Dehalococcoidia bacterium]|nr:pyruvate kinase [Dehalococcoidia bacterium]
MTRCTKIVCTLGPASSAPETIAAMIRAGMDVVRLNTSHGEIAAHMATLRLVREVARAEGRHIAVLVDLGGPKLRTGRTKGLGPIPLLAGATVTLTTEPLEGTTAAITVEYPRLQEDVHTGARVLLDDGKIELRVEQEVQGGLACRVVVGGELLPRKGVAFPDSHLTLPVLTDRDREAIAAGVAAGADLFALSFVRDAGDIQEARAAIRAAGGDTPIVAKIELREGVENLDAILSVADGAMVARGDLGVELPPEDVPLQQRRIIRAAARHRIPVITATQMLESMIDAPRPTRAESSDVANAVWDLSDALMLSGETAVGHYVVETVAMMDRIIRRAESATNENAPPLAPATDDHSYVVALAARRIVESDANMRGIACFTRSGYTARLMSKVHPPVPIFAITPDEAVARRLSLARSVVPLLGPEVETSGAMLRMVDQLLVEHACASDGDEVVVVASMPVQTHGTTNFLKLHTVGESSQYG